MSYGQGSVILKQKLPASSPVTAGARNGLTITSGYVELGGTLIQSTYIRTDGYYFYLGDFDSVANKSSFIIDDANQQISFSLLVGTRFLIDTAANTYKFGDISGLFNSSKIVIDDSTANKSITNTAATKHIWQVGTAGATEAMRIVSTANLLLGTTVDGGYKLDINGTLRATTLTVNTSGQERTISTYYGAGTSGNNIFIGGGGLSSTSAGSSVHGSYNTSHGVNALQNNTTGYDNTANGSVALRNNTTGHSNTANGSQALFSNTTGIQNTANGLNALYSNTTGGQNTAIGYYAGNGLTTGGTNIFLGYSPSATGITTGNYNTIIGGQITGLASSLSNNIILADGQGNQRIRILSDGSTGIGTTSPTAQLHTTGTVRFANFGAGTATFDASGNLSSVSDERLKDVQGGYNGGLDEIHNIVPIVYKWNLQSGNETEHNYIGFTAQNIQEALGEEAIGVGKDGYLSIQDRAIIATLVNAVQTLANKIDYLENQLNILN